MSNAPSHTHNDASTDYGKVAVVLFNLGGPTSLKGVKPFLFNLFKDRHIIPLSKIVRYPIAWIISNLRNKKATSIYKALGGKSPLNDNTHAQATALETHLRDALGIDAHVFMAMRYAPPLTEEVVEKVYALKPERILLLPLYPQFSTTTNQSSLDAWYAAARFYDKSLTHKISPAFPPQTLGSGRTMWHCCYPTQSTFIQAHVEVITSHINTHTPPPGTKILFSAHGIPVDMIEKGDPYESHVHKTVNAIMQDARLKDYEHVICYQSRVGPKKWLTPNIDTALDEAGRRKQGVMVVPISFVSDHSETLVELDLQYREYAQTIGLPHYSRVPSLGVHPLFIQALGEEVQDMLRGNHMVRVCDAAFGACPCAVPNDSKLQTKAH